MAEQLFWAVFKHLGDLSPRLISGSGGKRFARKFKRTTQGGGNSFGVFWGWYAGAQADYQFNKHWGVASGLQFQELGTYTHTFNGRQVSLDLSRSLFVLVGVSYNF